MSARIPPGAFAAASTTMMGTIVAPVVAEPAPRPARTRSRPRSRDGLVLLAVGLLLAAALFGAAAGRWTPGSDTGYWLGVAGGVSMLLLLAYPLRKRVRAIRAWGDARPFFLVHMAMGVVGPLLIVLHSRLEFGSLNATVAFLCMALVAASGLVGRFLYGRIHRGMHGEHETLANLRKEAVTDTAAMRDLLLLAPEAVARLDAFANRAEAVGAAGLAQPVPFFLLGFAAGRERRACAAEVRRVLGAIAATEGWSRQRLERRVARRLALIDVHLRSVQRLAQLAVFERLFSWWHVLHVPLFWLLVASAIAHVVAVHMY
jgi:hypothetical protein